LQGDAKALTLDGTRAPLNASSSARLKKSYDPLVCRCVAEGSDPTKATARQVMSKGIVFCRDEEELDDAARIMEHKKIRRLPVIDKDKRMIGMLSLGDVSQAGSRELTGEVMKSVSTHHGSTKKKSKRKA
jgi:predicted transcriptional regulator